MHELAHAYLVAAPWPPYAILNKENLYEDVLSSLNDGVMVISSNMEITIINTALENICGISTAHHLNRSFKDFSSHDTHLIEIVQNTLQTGQTIFDFEYNFFHKSGKSFPTDIAVLPLTNVNGNIIGAVFVIRDLRRIKKLKERVHHNEWLDNMEVMASGMAHEIKNPLSGIRGAAQLLLMELQKKELKEYLNVIIKEVDRINNIVENVLSLNKLKKIRVKPVNIHKIIEEILLLQKELPFMKNIQIKQSYDPSLPLVEADEGKLKQVFLNLIQNSVESMKNHGVLTLSTKLDAGFQILSKKQKSPTRMLLVEIKDTGTGLSNEIMDKLFTPFFTTKSKGTGLGLYISHKILDDHGGNLKLVNNKDKGSSARVYLPLNRK